MLRTCSLKSLDCNRLSVVMLQLYRATPCVARSIAIEILSVCPSVCHTRGLCPQLVDCVHMVRPAIMISSPYGSPIILVSGDITFVPKFEGGHPERGRWMSIGTNWRFSTFKPPYLRNGASKIGQRLLFITDRKSNTRFRLVPKSTTLVDPEMTLDGNYALWCITHMFFWEPTTKIWMH